MSDFAKTYIKKIIDLLELISSEEDINFNSAAKILSDAIEEGKRIFAFGSTHSATTMQDIYMRAGSLAVINAIFIPGLEALQAMPFGLTSQIERLQGYAKIALDNTPIRKGDVLIVVSVSGRNAVPIEFAKIAKERGIKVIAVTGLKYSKSVKPRHPDGKNMYEYADVILDNKAVPGDAIMENEKMKQKFCPASGVTSIAVLHCMVAATVEELLSRGIEPPVFMAQNLDGGEEYNKKMLKENRDRIFYLKPE
jgi:uncharacterized phosphosugar-binding protein